MKKKSNNISFPKRFIMSIKDIDQYSAFTEEKFLSGFYYFTILIAIFTLIITIASFVCLNYLKNGFIEEVKKVPDFKIENNEFSIDWSEDIVNEDTYYLKNLFNSVFSNDFSDTDYNIKSKVLLSNKKAPENIADADKNYEGLYLALYSDKVIFSSLANTMTYSYEELTNNYGLKEFINKQEFIDAIDTALNVRMFISMFIGFFLGNYLLFLIFVLTFALLGFILGKIFGLDLSYGKVLNISFSAITLPLIVDLIYKIVRMFTGFKVVHFDILFTILAYLYIVASIYLIYKANKAQPNKQRIKSNKEEQEEKSKLKQLEEEVEQEKERIKKKDRETEKREKTKEKQKPEPQANFKET